MFNRIKQLLGLGKVKNFQDPYIFHYFDGTRERSADPVEVEQHLIDCLGDDWRDKVIALEAPIPFGAIGDVEAKLLADRQQNRDAILKAINTAFGVKAYTDHQGMAPAEGLIDAMRFGLLRGYILFCVDLVRLARPFVNVQSRASPTPDNPQSPNMPESTSVETKSTSPATDS